MVDGWIDSHGIYDGIDRLIAIACLDALLAASYASAHAKPHTAGT